MYRFALALFIALFVLGAFEARAGDGDVCNASTLPACSYSVGSQSFFLLANKVTGGAADIAIVNPLPGDSRSCTCFIADVPAACPVPAITIQESKRALIGGTTVWHTLVTTGTGTGPGAVFAPAGTDPLRSIGPALRATMADPANASCSNNGTTTFGINVVCTCYY